MTNSGPYTVFDGTTLYHNRAYISLSTVYAQDQCGTVGTPRLGSILTLASSQIFSYDKQLIPEVCGDYGYSFNFANLLPNLPYSAFHDWPGTDKPGCSTPASGFPLPGDFVDGTAVLYGGLCSTIIDEMYFPTLVVPTEIRTLDPAWATCGNALEGLYDPPKALTAATTLDGLSGPYVVSTSLASPASTAHAPGPSPTTTVSRTVAHDPSFSANQPVPLPDTVQGSSPTSDLSSSAPAISDEPSSDGPSSGYADQVSSQETIDSTLTSSKPSSLPQYTSTPSTGAAGANAGAAVASILASVSQTYDPGQYGTSSTSAKDPGAVVASILANGGSTSPATDRTSTVVEDPTSDPLVFTAGGQVHSATNIAGLSGVFAVDGISITAGGSAQQISGHEISALSKGLVVDGTTVAPVAVSASNLDIIQSTQTGSDGQSITEDIIDGSITIQPGFNTVQDGHAYSLGPSGVVVDSTVKYTVPDSPISDGILFTAESQTLTANPIPGVTGVYVFDSTTVSADGSVMTVDGVTFTAQSSGLLVSDSQVMASSMRQSLPQSSGPQVTQTSVAINSGNKQVDGRRLHELFTCALMASIVLF
ncbi:hypothetical protein LTR10_003250 [Elasticomyces elasticus]|nr:hypothetical protein LTR10_003250 [Elasticomyces elasticus]KAK4969521.1 hypothetical protein LTR42_008792 [Elasticomyces elasticus]